MRSADLKKSNFYQPDTARTDRGLIDVEVQYVDGNIQSKNSPRNKRKHKSYVEKHKTDMFSDIDEVSDEGIQQKMSNFQGRDVKAKDHRYVVRRPPNWTDNILTENK